MAWKPRIEVKEAITLKQELDEKVKQLKSDILLAAFIENINVRGRIIEYLIAGEDTRLKAELVAALRAGDRGIPAFKLRTPSATIRGFLKRF